MKLFLIRLFPCFCLIFICSCTDDDDCPCTMEFRMITVVVVDTLNNLVLGLTTTVKDDSGKVYDVYNDPTFFPGHYTVMDDNYTRELTIHPKRFLFTGVKDSLTVNGEFFINTDECKCHVKKVSGPDTLILR
jgi:hypothetical protein